MLSATATLCPSLQIQRRRHGGRGVATKLRCAASSEEESFVEKLQGRVQREMLKHVDIEPRTLSSPVSFTSPQEEQIKKAERFVLDGWSSTSFHATGVLVAFLLAVMMILNSPMSTSHM